MAEIQAQFIEFHDAIKLGTYRENTTLRDKRDEVVKALRDGLKRDFEARGEIVPQFRSFDQGSYAMKTGIKPIKTGDYDIDVGISFFLESKDHDALKVKEWVHDALEAHTKRVEIRRPCVTVFYLKDDKSDEVEYHVDLAVYAGGSEGQTPNKLAKGKKHSGADHIVWEDADPEGLKVKIHGWSSNHENRAQFRRAVRALKRWKNERFSSGAPTGIALTVAAYYWFAVRSTTDLTTGQAK